MTELTPLRRELLQVNYAKASELAKLFQSVTGLEGATDERGSVTVDDRTNNIIAYQTGERLEELRRIVRSVGCAGTPGDDRGADSRGQCRL